MEKILYCHEERAAQERAAIDKAREQAQTVFGFIASKGIAPTRSDVENVTNGNLFSLVERFKKNEYEKVRPFTEQFGNTFLTDGIDEKIDRMAESFKRELSGCRAKIHPYAVNYFDYLDFKDVVSIKPEYDIEYFRKKHGVILSKPEHFDFYKKHVECCRLLNDLADHPANEFEALDRLFYFNTETGEFELNIEAYRPSIFEKADPYLLDFLN